MKFLFLLAVIAGTLALFNPSREDFEVYVRERMTDTISDHARAAGGPLMGAVAGALGGRLAGALAGDNVERDNYLAFSLYTVDLDGPDRDAEEFQFLGIAGQFIPLKSPPSLRERAGV